jgi:hypothetical protein
VTTTLAYNDTELITTVKSFIKEARDVKKHTTGDRLLDLGRFYKAQKH